jgi:hypothetical protein
MHPGRPQHPAPCLLTIITVMVVFFIIVIIIILTIIISVVLYIMFIVVCIPTTGNWVQPLDACVPSYLHKP